MNTSSNPSPNTSTQPLDRIRRHRPGHAQRVATTIGLALALAAGAGAHTATAGETTGSGKPITVHAKSECAFSGLDDIDEGEDPADPTTDDFGRTQNYGQIVRYAGSLGGVPGYACNPTRGFGG
jgi:hypothetical protein